MTCLYHTQSMGVYKAGRTQQKKRSLVLHSILFFIVFVQSFYLSKTCTLTFIYHISVLPSLTRKGCVELLLPTAGYMKPLGASLSPTLSIFSSALHLDVARIDPSACQIVLSKCIMILYDCVYHCFHWSFKKQCRCSLQGNVLSQAKFHQV